MNTFPKLIYFIKHGLLLLLMLTFLMLLIVLYHFTCIPNTMENTPVSPAASVPAASVPAASSSSNAQKKLIKWVDFRVTAAALTDALRYDVDSYGKSPHMNWIELLAYLAAKNGGDFSAYQADQMKNLVSQLQSGITVADLAKELKYYPYFLEAYTAVLGGMVGEYKIQIPSSQNPDNPVWVHKYGLKAFSPIARNFPYNHYSDFGAARTYGFKREHLGHDLMGQTGTPIIAVESGYVEAIGWNQYGGWRLGIRSFDKKRYYYYAHLRQNYPYHKSLKEGSIIQAGDVIGYMGRTGYSRTENTNNIDESHLHFGIQLIFDESQKDSPNEIWIDCYELTKFLYLNRSETIRNPDTKEHFRRWQMEDPAVPNKILHQQ